MQDYVPKSGKNLACRPDSCKILERSCIKSWQDLGKIFDRVGLGMRSQTTCSVSLFSSVYILIAGLSGAGLSGAGLSGARLSEVDCTCKAYKVTK